MKQKGLTGFQLKLIGLILMVFDHIYQFFPYSNMIPIGFKWVGRVVAPIFIFMTIEGYIHTRNKKKYMFRLYLGSIIMTMGNSFIPKFFERSDNFGLMNNIFATLLMITVYLCIVDFTTKAIKEKSIFKIFLSLILFIAPIALGILLFKAISINTTLVYLVFIIPNPIIVEGGFLFILFGIIMYLLRKSRKKLVIVYTVMSLATVFTGEISVSGLFMTNYQWMMVFAALLFYLYNGKKGKGMKYLFYVFYPIHIYAFYIVSSLMMNK